MSTTVGSQSIVIVRELNGKFELLRGIPERSVQEALAALDAICQLPPDPIDAAKGLKISWQGAELSASEFDKLHHDFTSALSQDEDESGKVDPIDFGNLLGVAGLGLAAEARGFKAVGYSGVRWPNPSLVCLYRFQGDVMRRQPYDLEAHSLPPEPHKTRRSARIFMHSYPASLINSATRFLVTLPFAQVRPEGNEE